jgi:hypothetical protein
MLTKCSSVFSLPVICLFLLEAGGHVSKPVKVVFLQDCPVRELGSERKFSVKVNVNLNLPGQGNSYNFFFEVHKCEKA